MEEDPEDGKKKTKRPQIAEPKKGGFTEILAKGREKESDCSRLLLAYVQHHPIHGRNRCPCSNDGEAEEKTADADEENIGEFQKPLIDLGIGIEEIFHKKEDPFMPDIEKRDIGDVSLLLANGT